jgi:PAS domain S-box-containing protein
MDRTAAAFLAVLALAEASPVLPHHPPPVLHWWLGGVAVTVAAVVVWVLVRRQVFGRRVEYLPLVMFFVAVQMLRASDGNGNAGFSPLLILAVVWCALYGSRPSMYVALAGVAAVEFGPLIFVGAPQYPVTLWRAAVLWVLILALVGFAVRRLVTALREKTAALAASEARFRTAFDDAPAGVALVGATGARLGVYLDVNSTMCALLGRRAEELVGRSVLEFTDPRDRGLTEQELLSPPDRPFPQTLEKRYLHSSGREVLAWLTFSRIESGPDGEPCFIVHVQDATLHRDAELHRLNALEHQKWSAERLEHLGQTHAVPADLVVRVPAEEAQGDQVSDVDLEAVLRGAIESIRPIAQGRGQALQVDVNLSGVRVIGNRDKIDRALMSLLDNAVKFTPTGGAIDLQARIRGRLAEIEVTDTGFGIDNDEVDRIFDRFYRARSATERAIPGSGLGLSIAKAIAEQHNGAIQVFSEPGAGSTFTLTLPLRTAGRARAAG